MTCVGIAFIAQTITIRVLLLGVRIGHTIVITVEHGIAVAIQRDAMPGTSGHRGKSQLLTGIISRCS